MIDSVDKNGPAYRYGCFNTLAIVYGVSVDQVYSDAEDVEGRRSAERKAQLRLERQVEGQRQRELHEARLKGEAPLRQTVKPSAHIYYASPKVGTRRRVWLILNELGGLVKEFEGTESEADLEAGKVQRERDGD